MSDITRLAFAQLTDADRLAVQLIRPRLPEVERMLHPTVVRIIWPTQPTIVDGRAFQETAAVVAKLFAGASTELARLRAMHRDLL
jgi:hypothetical protein